MLGKSVVWATDLPLFAVPNPLTMSANTMTTPEETTITETITETIEKTELPALTPVIKHVFKATHQSLRYIFKDGKNAAFFDFTYYTDVEYEIKELTEEIVQFKNPFFYLPEVRTVDMNTLDPLAELKRQLKAEAMADARSELLRDLGVTNGGADMKSRLQGLSNTLRVGQGAANSNSQA